MSSGVRVKHLRGWGIAMLALWPSAGLAQSASPQTTPSPWSLEDALGAPADLRISGTFRIRHDSIEGQPRPGFNAADDTLNIRTTIFAEYSAGPLRFGGEIYDSRVYFADAGTPIGTNEVNVVEPIRPMSRSTCPMHSARATA